MPAPIHFALGFSLLCTGLVAGEAPPKDSSTQSAITIYSPTPIKLRIAVSNPILHFRYAEMEGSAKRPEWYDAYYRLQRHDKFEYSDWIGYFSPEYIQKLDINPRMFAAAKVAYDKDQESSGLSSLLWEVFVEVDVRRFCFAVFYDAGHLDKVPISSADVPGVLIIRAFEFIEGRWKHQIPSATGILHNLPLAHRGALEALIQAKNGIVETPTRQAVPLPSIPQK